MAFDGVVAKCVVDELNGMIAGGRVEKIFQPEADEVIFNIRVKNETFKLLMSASPNYPRMHITGSSKENPSVPPAFCMLLRKHLSGAKISRIEFNDFERIISVVFESVDEIGEINEKKLIIEIMARYSNIILVGSEGRIIDSIKRVGTAVSSVREVMPGKNYTFPPPQNKTSPVSLDVDRLIAQASDSGTMSIEKYLLNNIKGFSPLLCREICFRAGIDPDVRASGVPEAEARRLKYVILELMSIINSGEYTPCIAFDHEHMENPVDFHCIELTQFPFIKKLPSISMVLDMFYASRDASERLKQKKSDLLRLLTSAIQKCEKKISIHREKLREVSDKETLRLCGELLTANIHSIPKNARSVSLLNYYSQDNEYIEIPLDENLSPLENAQMYFRRYSKAKSAFANAEKQLEESLKEYEYLEGVLHYLENCTTIQEIDEIRQELAEQGLITVKRRPGGKKEVKSSAPLYFVSSEGFDILVGKNNRQNEFLTTKYAAANHIWLHARNIPGSHVIIKGRWEEVPDTTLLEAAILASYHSKARFSSNVPVDYTQVKNVRKPPGAKPGMVIYDNYRTIIVTPDEGIVNRLKQAGEEKLNQTGNDK